MSAQDSSSYSATIFSHHGNVQHFVSKEHNCHNHFDANIPPVVHVKQGELVHVETYDCFHGTLIPSMTNIKDDGRAAAAQILAAIPTEELNPVTGPIYVQGAEVGDVLAVELLDIRPDSVGVATCSKDCGQLCHWMKKNNVAAAAIRFFDVVECQETTTSTTFQGTVTMRRTTDNGSSKNGNNKSQHIAGPISFPASPMLGVIGVAPRGKQPVLTMPAGKHGGNLDNRANGIGSTVYLNVNHPGGLLSIGDMHASQGDGEISGCGVEIGGNVLLRCRVLKRNDVYPGRNTTQMLEYPVTETATHWITHGVVVQDIPKTTQVACEEAAKILVGQWGFTVEEAFIFLSVQGNLGLCQACHPSSGTQIAKMAVPKLPVVCPRPFRMLCDDEEVS